MLHDIELQVAEGELVGVIGPNGAGKTSLLEAIAGFLQPQHGEVWLAGARADVEARKRWLFYLPDGIRPCPDHRAGDVLELFRRAHAQPAQRRDELVRALGIGGVLRKRVSQLSKGMSKRWLLALGMLTRAPLLLLDEPLDGLDLHQVAALGPLLRRLRDEGRTLMLSIHELSLAERLCERFLLLAEGRLLAAGDLEALRSRAGLERGGLAEAFLALT